MSVNNIDGNISPVRSGSNWHQDRIADNSGKKEKSILPAKEDDAVKISISQEGMKSYRKKLHESGVNESGKVIVKETIGEKMKRMAQAWKDAYRTSGSKEDGMEKVLSMLNGIFDNK